MPADSTDALVEVPSGVDPRVVDPVFVGRHPIAAGDAIWLPHGGLVWTLALRDDVPWVLELGDHPHRMEPVHTWASAPAHDPVLRWAGDLDEDGLLDVVVELSHGPLLFLSSRHTAVALSE